MSPEEYVGGVWPDSGDLGGTELTLALPGSTPTNASDGPKKSGNKRRFLETVYLKLGQGQENNCISSTITNGQLVRWPPVTTARKIVTTRVRRKYVKVAVDGAAYLRKVDLEMYDCYGQLFTALENMFQGIITICKVAELERKGEFVATYEDKDGDWMLVGDVPWMMFVESCKRMRLMRIGDAIGLYSSNVKRAVPLLSRTLTHRIFGRLQDYDHKCINIVRCVCKCFSELQYAKYFKPSLAINLVCNVDVLLYTISNGPNSTPKS